MLKHLLTFLAFVIATLAASAQSVRWEPGSGTLALNQLSELSLVFDQCEPSTDTVSLPSVPGLTFGAPSRTSSSSYTVVNFKATSVRTVTLSYRVRPTDRTTLVIPSFSVETDKGRQVVASATFEIGDATIGQSGLSIDQVAQSRFAFPSPTVWAGEVFPLTYTLNASKRYLYNLNKDFEWDPTPLSIEPWPNPEQIDALINNDQRVSIIYKTRAIAKTPGTYALQPATQLVNISTGSTAFGLFARSNITQLAVTSPRVDLTVRPLPSPAPGGFNGAVGTFTLDSKVVPTSAAVGEPITWTLTLDGTGNWPDVAGLPARSVSKDFRVVQPQPKRANKNNALFDASITEDIVLIPTKAGAYTLGPVSFTVFNPATGAYETLSTKAVTITIQGGTTSVSSGSPSPNANADAPAPNSSSAPTAPAPTTISAIPRDPLPPSGTANAPLSSPALIAGLVSSALAPLFVWLALALRRARLTDPARPLREAHARLAQTLRQLAKKPETGNLKPEVPKSETQPSGLRSHPSGLTPQIPLLLQHWQRDTTIFWRLPQAVPTPASFTDETWAGLWSDADRSLYGAVPLPVDWVARATQALDARRAPTFSAFQIFLPRNLLPLVVLLSSFVISHSSFAATSVAAVSANPVDAYAKGDFAAASTTWSEALQVAPTDWAAHHNLALALIQQNRSGEAAGHALAAFVQQPQNPSVRWHLAYAFKAASVTPPSLQPFLSDAPLASLARLASPTRWQALLIASAWLAAIAISLGIYGAYKKCLRKWVSRSLVVLSLLLAVVASLSLRTYGPLADARAVVMVTPTTLRSIPTDLDTPQKSSPLALGVVAATDKTFLGWRRLTFADGQTGWVRAETVVPLWR